MFQGANHLTPDTVMLRFLTVVVHTLLKLHEKKALTIFASFVIIVVNLERAPQRNRYLLKIGSLKWRMLIGWFPLSATRGNLIFKL